MRRKDYKKTADKISSVIAYAVLLGPVVILAVFMLFSYFGKIGRVLDDTNFHSPFEKKVYYTIDGEFYHDSKDCPVLKDSDRVYSAYKKELTGKTPCEQCVGRN